MKKGRRLFDILSIFVCVTAVWTIWNSEADKRAGNAFFDAPAAEILTTYRGAGYGGSSVLEYSSDGTAKYHVKELCGNDSILQLAAASDTTLDFTGKIWTGDARVLLELGENQEILEFPLEEGAQEIALPQGEYLVFLTGRDFTGGFSFSGENISVAGMEE